MAWGRKRPQIRSYSPTVSNPEDAVAAGALLAEGVAGESGVALVLLADLYHLALGVRFGHPEQQTNRPSLFRGLGVIRSPLPSPRVNAQPTASAPVRRPPRGSRRDSLGCLSPSWEADELPAARRAEPFPIIRSTRVDECRLLGMANVLVSTPSTAGAPPPSPAASPWPTVAERLTSRPLRRRNGTPQTLASPPHG